LVSSLDVLPDSKPPSFPWPVSSPTWLFEQLRSSYVLTPTWCVVLEPSLLFSLSPMAAIPSEPSPILPFVPAPFSDAKQPKQFGLVCLFSGVSPNRLATRSLKSLDPASLRATALLAAQHEAAEERWLDLPLFPPQV
jgi:hypothetical protein